MNLVVQNSTKVELLMLQGRQHRTQKVLPASSSLHGPGQFNGIASGLFIWLRQRCQQFLFELISFESSIERILRPGQDEGIRGLQFLDRVC